jgi:hypothetical protein
VNKRKENLSFGWRGQNQKKSNSVKTDNDFYFTLLKSLKRLLGYSNRDQCRSKLQAVFWCGLRKFHLLSCSLCHSWLQRGKLNWEDLFIQIRAVRLSHDRVRRNGSWIPTYIVLRAEVPHPAQSLKSNLLSEDYIWTRSEVNAAYWHKQVLCTQILLVLCTMQQTKLRSVTIWTGLCKGFWFKMNNFIQTPS